MNRAAAVARARQAIGLLRPTRFAAGVWALIAFAAVRRALRTRNIQDLSVLRPPGLPAAARSSVDLVLTAAGATCLQKAAVMQRWDRAHGRDRKIVIGVTPPSKGFKAHAWLEGDDPCHSDGFYELLSVTTRP